MRKRLLLLILIPFVALLISQAQSEAEANSSPPILVSIVMHNEEPLSGQYPFATGRFFEAAILAVDKEMGVRMAVGLEDNTGASRNDAWFLGVLSRSESLALGPATLVDAALHDQGEEYLAQVRA